MHYPIEGPSKLSKEFPAREHQTAVLTDRLNGPGVQSVPQILPTAQRPHILDFRVPLWDGRNPQRQVLA